MVAGSLQEQLDEQRARSAARRPPEVSAVIQRTIQGLGESGIAAHALGVGDRTPGFALPNVRGETIDSGGLLARGPVVLAFYRGVW